MARLSSLVVLLVCLPVLSGCGGVDEGGSERTVSRLVLSATEPAIENKTVTVATWEGNALGRIDVGRAKANLAGDRLILGTGTNRITVHKVPGRPFDRIVLENRSAGGKVMARLLDAKDNELARLPSNVALPKQAGRDGITVLQFPEALPLAGRVESIAFNFQACPRPPEIVSIRLMRAEAESWLPDVAQPEVVTIGDDGRRAAGLSSRRSVQSGVTGELADGMLTFSIGVPRFLRGKGQPPVVELTVADRARADVWTERYPVTVGRWTDHSYRIPESAAGHDLELSFELVTEGEDAVCALSVPIIEKAEKDPRTVLLITSDTHRADHMGLAENGIPVKTPFLDRLAGRGFYFDNCQAEGNNTNPTHVSVMTGVPLRDHGVIGNDIAVGDAALTLGEIFRDAGYHTYAAVSAAHLSWSGCPQGFDRLTSPAVGQRDSIETIEVLETWLEQSRHRSVFIWLHLFDAHAPYTAPEPFRDMYWREPKTPAPAGKVPSWASVDDVRRVVAWYQGEVTYLDHRLTTLFRAWPRLEQGVVALVGDHGENMIHPNDEWAFTHKGMSADTLMVPLLLTWPDAPAATRVSRPICQKDLGRTLLDVCGLGGVDFPGENVLVLAEESPEDTEEIPRFAIAGNAFSASLRRGPWMLVQGLYTDEREGGKRVPLHEVGLYDVEQDPGCRDNLVEDNHERACAMRSELVDWLIDSNTGMWGSGGQRVDEGTLAHLAGLGYAASSALPTNNPWIDPACECEFCERYPLLNQ